MISVFLFLFPATGSEGDESWRRRQLAIQMSYQLAAR